MTGRFSALSVRRPGAFLGAGLFCACVMSMAQAATVARHNKAPEATTPQAAVLKVCDGCHNVEIVTDTPMDYDSWHDTVQDMINRGAKGSDAEFALVQQYLFETVTTIDVNHADPRTLHVVLNAPDESVQAILARRQARPFKDLADLETIPGLDGPALEAKRRLLFFQ